MKESKISRAKGKLGFKVKSVPEITSFKLKVTPKLIFLRGISILASVVIAFSSFAPTVIQADGPIYNISCDNFSIDGDVWTFTGTWSVQSSPSLASLYDVALFAPSDATSATDGSSKDAPDTFENHSESGSDIAGSWSNKITFETPPTSVSASLFHNSESNDNSCDFTLTGSLTIVKETVNGDGTFNFLGGEVLEDFEITTIDNLGNHTYESVEPGFYIISEGELPTGWTQTENTCDDNDGGVTVEAGENTTCTITNTYTGGGDTDTYSISGKIYKDTSPKNGEFDETEKPLPGWTVYIDDNENDEMDDEERRAVSGEDGDYIIDGLEAGCYIVRQDTRRGWATTEPAAADDFEYLVSLGDAKCRVIIEDEDVLVSLYNKFIPNLFSLNTANAAVIESDGTNINFGNVSTQSTGGGSGGSIPTDGKVLGDFTGLPYQAPEEGKVLGVATELPRTGSSTGFYFILLSVVGLAFVSRKLEPNSVK